MDNQDNSSIFHGPSLSGGSDGCGSGGDAIVAIDATGIVAHLLAA